MIKRWCFYLALALGCLALNIAYQGWLAWILLMALLWFPALSLAVSLPAMLTVRMKAEAGGAVPMGTKAALRLKASCPLPMPQYRCRIRVSSVLNGEKRLLRPGEMLPTEHCGQLLCRLEKCWVYDYLGLFRLKVRKVSESATVVRPAPVKTDIPAEVHRYISRAWKPKPGGGFAENHELRLYRPGDNLNQLHWKLTAKTGKLIVREAMEPLHSRIALTMDLMGAPEELDRKMGRLLWLGEYLLDAQQQFEVAVLTGDGLQRYPVDTAQELLKAVDSILCAAPAKEAGVSRFAAASDRCILIGGGTDEKE